MLSICLLAIAIISYLPINEFGQVAVELSKETFTETAAQVDNPDRGLYSIFGFYITDQEEDYQARDDRLFKMIQINLAHYRDRELSSAGLKSFRCAPNQRCKLDPTVYIRLGWQCSGHRTGKHGCHSSSYGAAERSAAGQRG